MDNGDDILREFLVESYEKLDHLDQEIVDLEKSPNAKDRLQSIFRTIHTIKGTSGFFGFDKLGAVTHVGENLLSKLRDGELLMSGPITSALLKMVDAVREMLGSIEKSHDEGDGDYTELTARLTELLNSAEEAPAPPEELVPLTPVVRPAKVEAAPPKKVEAAPPKKVEVAPPKKVEAAPAKVEAAPPPPEPAPAPPSSETPQEHATSASDGSIRVDTTLLDKLMNLAGELVLARNQVIKFVGKLEDPVFTSTCQRLNLITSEMQEGVMRTRMQPIGGVLNKLPRVVRDLALNCGKQVRIEIEGKETDLDRTILEAIKDPLTHIVRNSIDHGIETPDMRLAALKPAEGLLRVRAFHEGGQVNIEISDDGAGIDVERVRQKAVERGVVSAAEAQRMGERELMNLIFLPGFSTATKVTNVSGRGVGMDVVKTNIQNIGGTVDVLSRPGFGTTLKIKIPLTLAIIPALIVTSAGDRYAIPQVSVLELVRLEGEALERGIERMHGAPVYRLRGSLLPLVYLDSALGVPGERGKTVNIVVTQLDDRAFGLVVDEVNDTEEIVVKPLDRQMKGVGPYAGATILGDGRVSLILDVRSIAHAAYLLSEGRDRDAGSRKVAVEKDDGTQALLLVRLAGGALAALPLSEVARLEEFQPASIEHSGHREVVQYRGKILPLLRVAQLLQLGGEEATGGPLQVVVHNRDVNHSVGLVVEQILDVVREPVSLDASSALPGVMGTVVLQKKVTELLDVRALAARAME